MKPPAEVFAGLSLLLLCSDATCASAAGSVAHLIQQCSKHAAEPLGRDSCHVERYAQRLRKLRLSESSEQFFFKSN